MMLCFFHTFNIAALIFIAIYLFMTEVQVTDRSPRPHLELVLN